jgi:hypothetical protein
MARIIVETDTGADQTVVLDEAVDIWELQDGRQADGLVERLGWAMLEAHERERNED